MKPGLQFGKANRKMMRTHGCRRALAVSGGTPTSLTYTSEPLTFGGEILTYSS